jgi:hypothetical protein
MEEGGRLMVTLWQIARRFILWVGLANLTTLLLLFTLLYSLILGLGASIQGLDVTPMFVMGVVGLLFGWFLTGTRSSKWKASGFFVASGILVSTLWINRLSKPLAILILAGGHWLLQALRLQSWTLGSLSSLDASAVQNAWLAFGQASQTTISRIAGWLQALVTGRPVFDPLVVQLFLALLVWLLSGWADWWVWRRRQPLIASAPVGAVLAVFLAYSGASSYLIIIWIGSVVALQALGNYAEWKRDWQSRHIDMAEIEAEWIFAVIGIVLFSMMSAMIVPSISIRKIADQIEQLFSANAAGTGPVNQAFGVKPRPRVASTPLELAQSPGLPNEHLLGSGPELSKKIVMWVSLASSQPSQAPHGYYWRSVTYDNYTGKGWLTLTRQTENISAGQSIAGQLAEGNLQEIVQQHVQVVGSGDGLLYVTGEVLAASEDYQIAWRIRGDLFGAEIAGRDYWVNSRLSQASPQQLRSAGNDYSDWVQKTYLALPEGLPQRVRNLALDLTAAQPTPYDRALAIERYLRAIPYSLDLPTPPTGRELVDYFIFDIKKGFCDYYASAMVVLARAAGVPARLVVGYANGTFQADNARFVVTEADAHSWVEVYFPGYGWVEFEPTGNRPEIDRPSEQDIQAMQGNPVTPFLPPEPAKAVNPWILFLWFGVALGSLLALWLLWLALDSWRMRLLPPGSVVTLLYRRLHNHGEKLLVQSSASNTPHEFMALLAQRLKALLPAEVNPPNWHRLEENMRMFVDIYARALYSDHPAGDGEKSNAIAIWKNLRLNLWQLRIKRIFRRTRVGENQRTSKP